jgi:hypothetical protein
MKKTISVWSITGAILCIVSAVLTYLHYESGMIWWMGVGATMGVGFFAILSSFQKGETVVKPELEGVQASLEAQVKAAQAAVEKEINDRKTLAETFRRKQQEAHEKCEAYKKLVDVHQFENGKLKQEAKAMSDDLLAKTRRISELELYLEDPKALPHADKELEFLYQQLKKQLEEKSRLLDQTRSELLQSENKLITLQKEHEEKTREVSVQENIFMRQLAEVEEEKQKAEAELASVQQLVTELTAKVEAERQKQEADLVSVPESVTQLPTKKKRAPAKKAFMKRSQP